MIDQQQENISPLEQNLKLSIHEMLKTCDQTIRHIEYFMDIEPGTLSDTELREYDLCIAVRRNLRDLIEKTFAQ